MKWLERSSLEGGNRTGRVRRMAIISDTYRQWRKCSNEKLLTRMVIMGLSLRSSWSEEKWCLISCQIIKILTNISRLQIEYFQHSTITRSLPISTRLFLINPWMQKDVSLFSLKLKRVFSSFSKRIFCQFHFSRGRKRFDYMFNGIQSANFSGEVIPL